MGCSFRYLDRVQKQRLGLGNGSGNYSFCAAPCVCPVQMLLEVMGWRLQVDDFERVVAP